jgi:5-methylcytosine-specific restriction endonuclease McrA
MECDDATAKRVRRRREMRKRKALPQGARVVLTSEVIARDPDCTYCFGCPSTTADHVVPLTRGGLDVESNLVGACAPCNSSKGDRLLSEWRGRYCPTCGLATGMVMDGDEVAA